VTGDDLAATSITSLKAWRGKLGRAYGDADAPSAEMDAEAGTGSLAEIVAFCQTVPRAPHD
jgi:hypothetical protein